MPKKSAALLGPGKGLQVQVIAPCRVQIKGMREGEKAHIERFFECGGRERSEVLSDGDVHFSDVSRLLQVEYIGTNRHFTALVFQGE